MLRSGCSLTMSPLLTLAQRCEGRVSRKRLLTCHLQQYASMGDAWLQHLLSPEPSQAPESDSEAWLSTVSRKGVEHPCQSALGQTGNRLHTAKTTGDYWGVLSVFFLSSFRAKLVSGEVAFISKFSAKSSLRCPCKRSLKSFRGVTRRAPVKSTWFRIGNWSLGRPLLIPKEVAHEPDNAAEDKEDDDLNYALLVLQEPQAAHHVNAAATLPKPSLLLEDAKLMDKSLSGKARIDWDQLAQNRGMARSTFETRAHACAEASLRNQERVLREINQYVHRLALARDLQPVAFIDHVMFDETPLKLTVSENHETVEHHVEKARVFVIESSWQMVLRRRGSDIEEQAAVQTHPPQQYLLLTGRFSKHLRTAEDCSGEGIYAILNNVTSSAVPAVQREFNMNYRLTEADSCPANLRAEKIFGAESSEAGSVNHLYGCTIHKVHAAAEKTWTLTPLPEVVSGLVNLGLLFLSPSIYDRFRRALKRELTTRPLRWHRCGSSSQEHATHRERVLRVFGPDPRKEPRRYAKIKAISTHLLNGNWDSDQHLEHFCVESCCQSEEQCREKIVTWGLKLLLMAKPTVFQKNNWAEWSKALTRPGLLQSCHKLLESTFRSAFGQVGPGGNIGDAQQPLGFFFDVGVPDAEQQMRGPELGQDIDEREFQKQQALMYQKKALALFELPSWHNDLGLLLQVLRPEQELMSQLLRFTSDAWEHEQLQSLRTLGDRKWRVLELQKQHLTCTFLQSASVSLHEPFLNFNEASTEAYSSKCFRLALRSPAVIYQLLMIPTQGFPYRLFTLLHDRSAENCHSILATPPCMLDAGSRQLLTRYNTVDHLQNDSDLFQSVLAMALQISCSTYTIERTHSVNARSKRTVVHTHVPRLEKVALQHSVFAGPSWLGATQSALMPNEDAQVDLRDDKGDDQEHLPRKRKARKKQQHEGKRRRGQAGGGGAWRAFIHDQVVNKGLPNDFGLLGRLFHNLSPEVLNHYTALGKQGSSTHVPPRLLNPHPQEQFPQGKNGPCKPCINKKEERDGMKRRSQKRQPKMCIQGLR